MVAQATQRLERLQAKQGSIEQLREAAEETRNDLVLQLQSMGVTGSTGLKGNAKARSLAATLETTVREIDGYQRDSARFIDALVQTQALLRRLERAQTLEEAGLSDQDFATLAETNLVLDEAAAGGSVFTTDPLQQEALLQRELAREPSKSTRIGSLTKVLVGKWHSVENFDMVEFTPQGKVLIDDKSVATYKVTGATVTLLPISRERNGYHDWKKLVVEAEMLSSDTLVFSLVGSPGGDLPDELESLLGKVERNEK
jgi:hypothetical protein